MAPHIVTSSNTGRTIDGAEGLDKNIIQSLHFLSSKGPTETLQNATMLH